MQSTSAIRCGVKHVYNPHESSGRFICTYKTPTLKSQHCRRSWQPSHCFLQVARSANADAAEKLVARSSGCQSQHPRSRTQTRPAIQTTKPVPRCQGFLRGTVMCRHSADGEPVEPRFSSFPDTSSYMYNDRHFLFSQNFQAFRLPPIWSEDYYINNNGKVVQTRMRANRNYVINNPRFGVLSRLCDDSGLVRIPIAMQTDRWTAHRRRNHNQSSCPWDKECFMTRSPLFHSYREQAIFFSRHCFVTYSSWCSVVLAQQFTAGTSRPASEVNCEVLAHVIGTALPW